MTKISLPRVCRAGASPATCMVLLLLFAGSVFADVGSNNPTGTAGQYNSNIEVGVDPFTMNATRSITDLVVAGGTGSYPLAFTRTMNSRFTVGVGNLPVFGAAGSWTHSYQWTIDAVKITKTGGVGRPSQYNVNYPDGRRVSFSNANLLNGATDPDFRGPLGVRDRFEQLASGGTECYVRLTDGGKIWFHANVSTTVSGTVYTTIYTFTFKGIYDPYGQLTTATYASDGSSMTITEPSGRTIKIVFTNGPAGDKVVNYITGSDGRTVTYNYSAITANGITYSALTSVRYFGDPTWDATYTYQVSNVTSVGRPLIATCTDPMFDGPLWKVAYDFAQAGTNADNSAVVYGQVWHIKHPNGTLISTLTINASPGAGWSSRSETRGDNPTGSGNPSRLFTYHGYRLEWATDFKGIWASQTYDSNNYLHFVTDRRGNTTRIDADNAFTGTPGTITYPPPGDVSPSGTQTIVNNQYSSSPDTTNPLDPNNPYWLGCIRTPNHTNLNGTNYVDTYFRTANRSLSYVIYYDGTNDAYTYNQFGQLQTHRDQLGSLETYVYGDTANPSRVTAYYDAARTVSAGIPTAQYQYDAYGRVYSITVPRQSGSSVVYDTTTFQYNLRGQLTRLTHPDGTYIQYAYNPEGTLQWTADERHSGAVSDSTQRTSYTYDDYKRLRSLTTPLRAAGDTTSRVTTYFYDQNGTGEDWTRTAAVPTKVVSPGGKVVTMTYDEDLRTLSVTAAGDTNVPNATTSYTYDPNGNVLTVKDPNGQTTGAVTTYAYDCLNRVMSETDPNSLYNSSGHSVDYLYDIGGRLVQMKNADNKTCSYTYDDMGRMTQKTGFAGEVSQYSYDNRGNLTGIVTPNQSSSPQYIFGFDALGRKTVEGYPSTCSGHNCYETYTYDAGNRLRTYTNPAGQTKTLIYDNRGRLTDTSWDSNGPSVHITYDATRPTAISSTQNGVTTTIGFGYDEANNRTYEDQTVNNVTHRVETDPDADGNRKNLLVKTGNTTNSANFFDYTSRNELLNIRNSSNAPFFTYSYDASGNVTQRVNQTFANAADKVIFQYDALNRPTLCAQYAPGNSSPFATGHYTYSRLGKLQNVTRDEDGGKGDYFTYDDVSQVNTAAYLANSATDSNAAKSVSYNLDATDRFSMTVADNVLHATTTTNYAPNSLHQFATISVNNVNQSLAYDSNFNLTGYNGLNYVYDAENRLTAITGTHTASFAYDGVGRCVKRTIDGATTIFSYDQWTPVAEWDQNNNLIATNVYGLKNDEILYRSAGSTQLFYKSDPMGNVTFLLNGSGAGIEKYKYDAFGVPTVTNWNGTVHNPSDSSSVGNHFMLSGREYLQGPQNVSPLRIYDMRNRVYDPTTGHFHQTDPIGFDGDPYNLYRFSGNNPLLGGDPTGLASTTIWTDGSDWDWYSNNSSSSDNNGSSDFASSDLGSEISVYNGAAYAYGNGYGPHDKYMDAIFGSSTDNNTAFFDSDFSFAGEFPVFSGTSTFGSLASSAALSGGSQHSNLGHATGSLFNYEAISRVLFTAGVAQTVGNAAYGAGSVGSNWAYYASGWGGGSRASITTLKLAMPLKVAGSGLAGAGIVADWMMGVPSGKISPYHASVNTTVTLIGLANPITATYAVAYGGVDTFYPGGWLGDGSGKPFHSAGLLSDEQWTIEANRMMVPNWNPLNKPR